MHVISVNSLRPTGMSRSILNLVSSIKYYIRIHSIRPRSKQLYVSFHHSRTILFQNTTPRFYKCLAKVCFTRGCEIWSTSGGMIMNTFIFYDKRRTQFTLITIFDILLKCIGISKYHLYHLIALYNGSVLFRSLEFNNAYHLILYNK